MPPELTYIQCLEWLERPQRSKRKELADPWIEAQRKEHQRAVPHWMPTAPDAAPAFTVVHLSDLHYGRSQRGISGLHYRFDETEGVDDVQVLLGCELRSARRVPGRACLAGPGPAMRSFASESGSLRGSKVIIEGDEEALRQLLRSIQTTQPVRIHWIEHDTAEILDEFDGVIRDVDDSGVTVSLYDGDDEYVTELPKELFLFHNVPLRRGQGFTFRVERTSPDCERFVVEPLEHKRLSPADLERIRAEIDEIIDGS